MMEQKVTIQKFALKIAEERNLNAADVELVLKEMFRECGVKLQNASRAAIPGFAEFVKTEGAESSVDIVVDKKLAEAINAPFESLPAVELSEGYVEEAEVSEVEEKEPQKDEKERELTEEEKEREQENEVAVNEETEVEVEAEAEAVEETEVCPPPVPATPLPVETPPPFNHAKGYETPSNYVIEQDEEMYVEHEERMSLRKRFVVGLICGVVICLVLVALAAVYYTLVY